MALPQGWSAANVGGGSNASSSLPDGWSVADTSNDDRLRETASNLYSDTANISRSDYDINPSVSVPAPFKEPAKEVTGDDVWNSLSDSLGDVGSNAFPIVTHSVASNLEGLINLPGAAISTAIGGSYTPYTGLTEAADTISSPLTTNAQREASGVASIVMPFGGETRTGAGVKMGARKFASETIKDINDTDKTINDLTTLRQQRPLTNEETAAYTEALDRKEALHQELGVSPQQLEQARTELSLDQRLNEKGYKGGVGLLMKKKPEEGGLPSEVWDALGIEKTRTAKAMSKLQELPGMKVSNLKESRVGAVKSLANEQLRTLGTTVHESAPQQDLVNINSLIKDGKFSEARTAFKEMDNKLFNDDGSYSSQISPDSADQFNKLRTETNLLIDRGEAASNIKNPTGKQTFLRQWSIPAVGAKIGYGLGAATGIPGAAVLGGFAGASAASAIEAPLFNILNKPLSANVARGLNRDVSVVNGEYSPTLRATGADMANKLYQGGQNAYNKAGINTLVGTNTNTTQAPESPSQSISNVTLPSGWTVANNATQSSTEPSGGNTMPIEQNASPSTLADLLYKGFQTAETGGQSNPWIRTQVTPDKNGGKVSSAVGPVQITGTRINDFLSRHADDLPPEVRVFAYRLAGLQKANLHAEKGSGYGHGEGGYFSSDSDKAKYEQLAKAMLLQTYKDTGGDISATIKSWRGVDDAPYARKVMNSIG